MIPLDASLRSYDSKTVSEETSFDTGDKSLVQQHFQDEVDINTIVRRFGLTRAMPGGVGEGVYGDFTEISDYESAVEKVERARSSFMKLPADVRERVHNDPGELIRLSQELTEEEFLGRFRAGEVVEPLAPPAPVAPVVTSPPNSGG